ncbi:TetR/AcrR family transcriptional regulator [Aeromicrobium sp. 179-A 4D2 NHS]|uniref:TetR/AcrR family transcriptional regulator n=1 Tax=Aeromicrobium sp. 179-A 4D2 NHS TaxID=3142375 RepID=UPI0039A31C89
MGTRGPRERLLDATITSLRRHGVHGTGIAEVLGASGAARQSIYQHFPGGKADLVAEAARRAGARLTRDAPADPHAYVDDRLDWWVDQLRRHDFALGCPVAAAALAGADSPGVVAAAAEVFADWTEHLATVLTDAGAEPEAARRLGRFHVSAVEGAGLMAQALRSVEPVEDLRAILHGLIDDVLPH